MDRPIRKLLDQASPPQPEEDDLVIAGIIANYLAEPLHQVVALS